MDTFFEQIVRVKFSAKDWLLYFLIWAAGGFLALLCFAFLSQIALFLTAVIIFFAFKFSNKLFVEYEYIFTNGDLDFDKIIAKSARKRMAAINCKTVERYAKYDKSVPYPTSVKKVYMFCNKDDKNAKYMITPHKNEGTVMIIFAPEERIDGAISKAVPRIAQ